MMAPRAAMPSGESSEASTVPSSPTIPNTSVLVGISTVGSATVVILATGQTACQTSRPASRHRGKYTALGEMWRMRLRRLAPVVALAVLAVPLARAGAAGVVPDPVDCVSPAGDPAPGTQAWQERDQANQWCATQRQQDEWSNEAAGQAGAE